MTDDAPWALLRRLERSHAAMGRQIRDLRAMLVKQKESLPSEGEEFGCPAGRYCDLEEYGSCVACGRQKLT